MSACKHCGGAGKVKSDCPHCDNSKGYQVLTQSWAACHHCSNLRCIKCGGDGVEPRPTKLPAAFKVVSQEAPQ